jgi:hypothetical protein
MEAGKTSGIASLFAGPNRSLALLVASVTSAANSLWAGHLGPAAKCVSPPATARSGPPTQIAGHRLSRSDFGDLKGIPESADRSNSFVFCTKAGPDGT